MLDHMYIQSALALSSRLIVLLCFDEDTDGFEGQNHIVIVDTQDIQSKKTLVRQKENVKLTRSPIESGNQDILVLSRQGEIERISISGQSSGFIIVPWNRPHAPSQPRFDFLTNIKLISGKIYVCGLCGQIYMQDDDKSWQDLSYNLYTVNDDENWISNIEKVGKDMYLSGPYGSLFLQNGNRWDKISLTTNASLGELLSINATEVGIFGDRSTVVLGNSKTGFLVRTIQPRDLTIYSVCQYQSEIFIGTDTGLMIYDIQANSATNIFDKAIGLEIHSLQAVNGSLWAFGPKTIAMYNGSKWLSFFSSI